MRSENMQVLTNQLKAMYPGVTIYGIGDDAHKLEVSGHNEDDTPGVRAEDQDPDNIPEHRALDVMIGNAFSADNALSLVKALVGHQENRARLLYVIYDRRIWSRSNSWMVRAYTGSNPHTDHPHISGEADDDDNTSPWILTEGAEMAEQYEAKNDVHAWAGLWRLAALTTGADRVQGGPLGPRTDDTGNPVPGEEMWLVQTLKRIERKLDSLAVGGVDVAELRDAMQPMVEETVRAIFRDGGTPG